MIALLALWAALNPLAGTPAWAQNVNWIVHAATAPAQLGVPVELTGTVTSSFPQDLVFDVAASTDAAYAVANTSFGQTALSGGLRVQPFAVAILPLAVGKIPVSLVCASSSGPPIFKSPPVLIDVAAPSLPKNAQPLDIKAPRTARAPLWPWILLAILIAAGYWFYRWFSQRRSEELEKEPADMRPAEVIAESDLQALQGSGLWESGRYKDFYSALTDILKRYLERRRGFAAPQMTTSEILRALRDAGWDRAIMLSLRNLLDRADLIKFAKIPPETAWGQTDIAAATQFVRETTPHPAPPQPPPNERRLGEGDKISP